MAWKRANSANIDPDFDANEMKKVLAESLVYAEAQGIDTKNATVQSYGLIYGKKGSASQSYHEDTDAPN